MRQLRAEIGVVSKADGYKLETFTTLFAATCTAEKRYWIASVNDSINWIEFEFVCGVDCSSAVFEMGNTKVIAAVYGPREVIYFSQRKSNFFF